MRRVILVTVIVFGLAVLVAVFTKRSENRLEVRTYFQDARGVRAGAPVRVAGVEVGRVTDVRVRPELKGTPGRGCPAVSNSVQVGNSVGFSRLVGP